MSGVFLSYAREDGEEKAAAIRERLAREASDIVIKQDRLFMEGGVGWWQQIQKAIDSVEFLVLVMTPAAIRSGNVQKEWRYARQQGVCIHPVKGAPDADLFGKMPRWMSKVHFYDLDKEWPTFLGYLRSPCGGQRVPFMAPDLLPRFVERPQEYEAIKRLLLSPDRSQPIAITTSLSGAGGFGKTTLATALCHDEDIIENFDGGILWTTLGQRPDVLKSMLTLFHALTSEPPAFANAEDAAIQLERKLEERACLLVIDDVWEAAHLGPFLRGGKSAARLITTRNSSIAASLEVAPVNVDEMRSSEAVSLLTKHVEGLPADRAQTLATKLGEWPLALELAASMIRERVRLGQSAGDAAERLLTILDRKGWDVLVDPADITRQHTISSVLNFSLELLGSQDRQRLADLSIFPDDVAIPLAAAAAIWELDEIDSEMLAQLMARLSLVRLDLKLGVLGLHDVLRSWLASRVADPSAIHNRLVNAWPNWATLPHLPGEYAWRWLPWHLLRANRKQDAARILWDPGWMVSKLKATEPNALIADYDHLKPSPEADLLQDSLRLSANRLAADVGQFASQVAGRLLPYLGVPAIQQFVAEVTQGAPAPWLRLLHPALHPPGTGLVRTLEGHSGRANGVAVTPDGLWAVSASADNTLKVWELDTGIARRTLKGHSDEATGVAVTPDGKWAVSASDDETLSVWDLESGRELHSLKGHEDRVNGVAAAVTPDGRWAVSASADQTLKMWNLDTGAASHTLIGHSGEATSVAVAPDGKWVVSASSDETLKVWDLDSGRELCTLKGHSREVNGVAVTPNGKRAVSASSDMTLKIWDMDSGCELHTLEGHSFGVNSVAVTPDGRQAVSASSDNTLKVWDLDTGRVRGTLTGHSDGVNCVAVAPDGRRAVSASSDTTLKIWSLESDRAVRSPEAHAFRVLCVAVTPDGRRAVSASSDNTLKVWDVDSGQVLMTLVGHSDAVRCVVITPDGKRAVSASADLTLTVWDLDSGRALRTHASHAVRLNCVAVTPDGRRAVSAFFASMLWVWDLESGRPLVNLGLILSPVNAVAVTPDGQTAISASAADKTLRLWDLKSGRALHTLEGHSASVLGVAVSPDGKRAVSASADHTLKVWDLDSYRKLLTLKGHTAPVNSVSITPDGTRAVSASSDCRLKVWDLDTGSAIATFYCDGAVRSCAFAGERTIVAGDQGGRLYFLRIEERPVLR